MLGQRIQTGRLPPQPFGRFVSRARLKRGISGRGQFVTIPLFVGVEAVNIPKKFDVHAAVEDAFSHLDDFYRRQFQDYDGRKTSFV
jgi:hypothetical protein